MHDLKYYQSGNTAWRYKAEINSLKADIESRTMQLHALKERLKYLETHPPLYEHFNWSA